MVFFRLEALVLISSSLDNKYSLTALAFNKEICQTAIHLIEEDPRGGTEPQE